MEETQIITSNEILDTFADVLNIDANDETLYETISSNLFPNTKMGEYDSNKCVCYDSGQKLKWKDLINIKYNYNPKSFILPIAEPLFDKSVILDQGIQHQQLLTSEVANASLLNELTGYTLVSSKLESCSVYIKIMAKRYHNDEFVDILDVNDNWPKTILEDEISKIDISLEPSESYSGFYYKFNFDDEDDVYSPEENYFHQYMDFAYYEIANSNGTTPSLTIDIQCKEETRLQGFRVSACTIDNGTGFNVDSEDTTCTITTPTLQNFDRSTITILYVCEAPYYTKIDNFLKTSINGSIIKGEFEYSCQTTQTLTITYKYTYESPEYGILIGTNDFTTHVEVGLNTFEVDTYHITPNAITIYVDSVNGFQDDKYYYYNYNYEPYL